MFHNIHMENAVNRILKQRFISVGPFFRFTHEMTMDERLNVISPNMEQWKTPTFTGYPCKVFPSWNTQSCLLPRNEKISPNNQTETPQDLNLKKRLTDTTVSRPTVEWKDLKPYWKSEKKLTVIKEVIKKFIHKFFKDFISRIKMANKTNNLQESSPQHSFKERNHR